MYLDLRVLIFYYIAIYNLLSILFIISVFITLHYMSVCTISVLSVLEAADEFLVYVNTFFLILIFLLQNKIKIQRKMYIFSNAFNI